MESIKEFYDFLKSYERVCEKRENGKWVLCEFDELKKGDYFRQFDITFSPVVGNEGGTIFEATSLPDIHKKESLKQNKVVTEIESIERHNTSELFK